MHLQHPVRHSQSDTASRFLGREIKIENLVANVGDPGRSPPTAAALLSRQR